MRALRAGRRSASGSPGSTAGDEGSALVEFVGLAVLVMVPIAYAVILVVQLHSATYAAVTAAREAGRAYVTAGTPGEASARATRAARIAMEDQHAPAPELDIACLGGACLSPGSRVRVTVTSRVPIPFVPRQGDRGTIAVSAEHEAVVDTYRASS